MTHEMALESPADEAEERRFNEAAWPLDPQEEPKVRYWRIASRTVLFGLLAFSSLQYYFFDVYLTIMALPRAGVLLAAS